MTRESMLPQLHCNDSMMMGVLTVVDSWWLLWL